MRRVGGDNGRRSDGAFLQVMIHVDEDSSAHGRYMEALPKAKDSDCLCEKYAVTVFRLVLKSLN